MAKIVALAAYFYQAAVAFGLLIAVAHLLAPADYAAYSLFIAITQFAAIFCFEWIRFACSRFYPGQTVESEPAQRKVLALEFAACAVLCLAVAAASVPFGVPASMALMGALVAIFQGGSDLHLTMLRFRQEFRGFSRLQGSRATILAVGTLAGAGISPSFTGSAAGLVAGYLAYGTLAVLLSRGETWSEAQFRSSLARQHFVYGSVAAGASVVGLLAPLGLKSVLAMALGAGGAAGALLALDLLQKPFVLIVSALQAIQYPDVVVHYDRDGETVALRRRLGDYYALLTGFTLMTAAGIFALLQPVGLFVIAPALQDGFREAAPFVTGLSLLRALTLNMLPTPAHLRHRLSAILALAVADCLLLNAGALAAGYLLAFDGGTLMLGAMAGALLAVLIGLRVLFSLPFDFVWQPVLLSAAGFAMPVLASVGLGRNLWMSVGVGVLGAAIFCLAGLYSYFTRMVRPQSAS